ncbi:hypothetical protein CYY_004401 [Polysphondylium violaceum]|uniref:Uncharacterized protein n=1 Tax=Polysphondylium violaceum TaxID=133409 RepID=A0A8J4PWU5_9MYCE|nr:hypothetical protein CYY_004401 [Polysphondylium violaceum]
MTTTTLNTLFFKIWNDKYLQDNILTQLFENVTIGVSTQYLIQNQSFLKRACKYIDIKYRLDKDSFVQFGQLQSDQLRLISDLIIVHNNTTISDVYPVFASLRKLYLSNVYLTDIEYTQVIKLFVKRYHHSLTDLELSKPNSISRDLELYSMSKLKFFKLFAIDGGIEVNALPHCLETLDIYKTQVKLVKGLLPETLRRLIAGVISTVDGSRLPVALETLKCESCGDFPPLWLPNNLKSLRISRDDFSLVPGSLPSSLLKIKFYCFNKPLVEKNIFPQGLKKLYLSAFNSTIEPFVLPNGLTSLILIFFNPTKLASGVIPSTVTFFHAPSLTNPIPISLSTTTKMRIRRMADLEENPIPSTIKDLVLHVYQPPLGSIPNSVTRLDLECGKLSPGLIPTSVTHLRLSLLNQEIDLTDLLPKSITTLILEKVIGKTWKKGEIPDSVTKLSIMGVTRYYSEDAIPPSVVVLKSLYDLPFSKIPRTVRTFIQDGQFMDLSNHHHSHN